LAQYTEGNVTLAQNSATAVGASCDWLTASNVKVGDLFKRQGVNAWYQVTSVNTATNLNISPVYAQANASNVSYVIARDFTTNYDWPEISGGDYDWPDAYTRAVRGIDSKIASVSASSANVPQGGNKWWTIAGDAGSTTPNASQDTLTFAGQGGITASIDGDTVTIRDTGGAAKKIKRVTTTPYYIGAGVTAVVGSVTAGSTASIFLSLATPAREIKFAVSTGSMVINASGSDTIEGNATIGMYSQYNTANLANDGVSTWYIF
jgi:hypothetical protein